MAFTGDLEHLPIVDVIQLMNSTRKSGVLVVKGRKGESQVVFKDGYIVSASHLNNSVRIGQVLVDMGLVSPAQIEQGLRKQQSDGEQRRPLAITLIEMDLLKEQDAYNALQRLIEMTIVEILTWKSGKFTLDHLKDNVDCDFKYYPEKMNHEVNINTQSILMDALRIFDEKMRDGLIEEEQDLPGVEGLSADELISADDLGLSEIDSFSAKLPQAFSAVVPFDPAAFQRQKVAELAADLAETERERLVSMLAGHTMERTPGEVKGSDACVVVTCSSDRLMQHALDTVLHDAGVVAVSVADADELEKTISAERKIDWLVIDAPVNGRLLAENPQLKVALFSRPDDFKGTLNAYRSGVRAVLPVPVKGVGSAYVDELILLLEFLPEYLQNYR